MQVTAMTAAIFTIYIDSISSFPITPIITPQRNDQPKNTKKKYTKASRLLRMIFTGSGIFHIYSDK